MKVQPEDGLAPVAEDKTNFVFKVCYFIGLYFLF